MASIEDDEIQVNNQSWKKLHLVATKSGYREGIADGRNSNFQISFDAGYKQGFNNGFALGVCKGITSSTDRNQIDEMLQKVSRGNCVLCKNKELENNTHTDLANLQTTDTNNVLEVLNRKYAYCKSVKLAD